METALAGAVALLFAASIYLMLSRHLVRVLIGIAILGNGVNLFIFTVGRLTREVPPFVAAGAEAAAPGIANPLPQALVLTAIVISFAFLAFLLVLGFRAHQELGTDDTLDMRIAEPAADAAPPRGY